MKKQIQKHLASKDEILKDIVNQISLPALQSTNDVFHDLMSCIIEQQIHYRSTKKIFQKMLDASSIEQLTPQNFAIFEEKAFQSIKLSTNKYETILRVVDFFQKNKIDWKSKTDEEVVKLLGQIKGVGPWTIDMILLYTLERENIFPADDYHLKLMMGKMYPINQSAKVKAQMKNIAAEWSPYQSYAVKYLLAWKVFQKKSISRKSNKS